MKNISCFVTIKSDEDLNTKESRLAYFRQVCDKIEESISKGSPKNPLPYESPKDMEPFYSLHYHHSDLLENGVRVSQLHIEDS